MSQLSVYLLTHLTQDKKRRTLFYLLPVRRRTFFSKKVKKELLVKSTFNCDIALKFNLFPNQVLPNKNRRTLVWNQFGKKPT